MSTEAIDRSRTSASPADRDERAREAVKIFRKMQHGLTSYARAITGDKKVRVEVASGAPRTDGRVIYYSPPIRLGDKTKHVRRDCDSRDPDTGLMACPACAVREEVLVNIYHEIAHIAFQTFAPTTERARRDALTLAVEEWGTSYSKQIERALEDAPDKLKLSYLGLARFISPFLPHLVNCLDDARVDGKMFNARKGTRKMFEADTYNLLRQPVGQNEDGTDKFYYDLEMNTQAGVACYLAGAGYTGWQKYMHPKIGEDFKDPELLEQLARCGKAKTIADIYSMSFPILAKLRDLGYMLMPDEKPEPESDPEEENEDDQPDAGPGNPDGDEDRPEDQPSPDDDAAEGGDEQAPDPDGSGQPGDPESAQPGSGDEDDPDAAQAGSGDDRDDADPRAGAPERPEGEAGDGSDDDQSAQPQDGDASDGADGAGGEPGEGDDSTREGDGDGSASPGGPDQGDDSQGGQASQEGQDDGGASPEAGEEQAAPAASDDGQAGGGEAGPGQPGGVDGASSGSGDQGGPEEDVRPGGDGPDSPGGESEGSGPDSSGSDGGRGDEGDAEAAGEAAGAGDLGEAQGGNLDGAGGVSDGDGDSDGHGASGSDDAGVQPSDQQGVPEAGDGSAAPGGDGQVDQQGAPGDPGDRDGSELRAGDDESREGGDLDLDGDSGADRGAERGDRGEPGADRSDQDADADGAERPEAPGSDADHDGVPGEEEGDASGAVPGMGSDDALGIDPEESDGGLTGYDYDSEDHAHDLNPEHDSEDGDVEAVDSGADKGEGGIKAPAGHGEGITIPKDGTPEDMDRDLENLHDHIGGDDAETQADEIAIKTAIIQGAYFESPSEAVTVVNEWRDMDEAAEGWDTYGNQLTESERIEAGIKVDLDIPESVMGPALLKTRRIFSDNKLASHQRNLRSGRINAKVLGRRAWSEDDRLFSKKRLPGKQDYAVLIGLDASGSQIGSNMALTKRAAWAQAELCHRAGIPFAIYAHTTSRFFNREGGLSLDLYHIKDFKEPWNDKAKEKLEKLVATGGNLDGHTMEFYRKELDKVSATDKILLYYTDGKMPAANHDEELEVLQREIKICKQKNYTLLGVGIRTDSPRRHGLDTVQVDGDEELKTVVEHLGKRLATPAR